MFKKEYTEIKEKPLEQPVEKLKEGEKSIFNKAADFLENLPGKVLEKSRRAKAIAAFSLLLQASTIFTESAWAQENKKYTPEDLNNEPSAELNLKTQPILESAFDWKKIVNEINISYENPYIPKKTFETEEIKDVNVTSKNWKETKFYGTQKEDFIKQPEDFYKTEILKAKDVDEYFSNLETVNSKFNDRQKIYTLQILGQKLGINYNNDLAKAKDKSIEISDEAMLESIQTNSPSGICTNIHYFMIKSAQRLGMEAWLQNGYVPSGNHEWMGTIAKKNDNPNEKQIVFIDYDAVIPTGTLNYKEALGIMERRNKEISLFDSFVGDTKEILFPVETYAQETMKKTAGFDKQTGETLSETMETGEIEREKSLDIKFNPETKSMELSRDHIGLYYLNYKDSGNVYNSLEELNAARGTLRVGGKKLDIEGDITIMHLDIKDLGTRLFPRDAVISRLAANFVNTHSMTKEEFGKFSLRYGATFEAGIANFLAEGEHKAKQTSKIKDIGKAEADLGIRFMYINPAETGKLFLEVQEAFGRKRDDVQNQEFIIQEIMKKITVGGEYKTHEGNLVNLDAAISELKYGRNFLLNASINGLKFNFMKEVSDYERFKPSKEELGASFSSPLVLSKSNNQPIGEINVFGAIGKEKYKNANPQKTQNVGVKMRFILW